MHDPNADAPLFNAVPPLVVVIAVLIGVIEVAFQLGEAGLIGGPAAVGWRLEITERFGLYTAALEWMWENGRYPLEHLLRLIAYPFLHQGGVDALLSAVFVLALGKFVAERMGNLTVTLCFFVPAVFTGLAAALILGPRVLLIGAWAPICGLIGALTWALFLQARATGGNPVQAFGLIGALAVIQAIFWGMFGGTGLFEIFAGFVAGFAVAALLHPSVGEGPGGWLDRARSRD